MAIEKGRAASASTPTAPWDTLPRLIISSLRPGKRASPPTGATALLVQHEPNHHSHNDAANHLDSDVPEEVSHGVPSFQESAPRRFSIRSLCSCQRTAIRTPRRVSACLSGYCGIKIPPNESAVSSIGGAVFSTFSALSFNSSIIGLIFS